VGEGVVAAGQDDDPDIGAGYLEVGTYAGAGVSSAKAIESLRITGIG
jgi:hypothetical protein